jgi:hypothetical protein
MEPGWSTTNFAAGQGGCGALAPFRPIGGQNRARQLTMVGAVELAWLIKGRKRMTSDKAARDRANNQNFQDIYVHA